MRLLASFFIFIGGAIAVEPVKGTGNIDLIHQFLKIHLIGLGSRLWRRRLLRLGLQTSR